MAKIYGSGLGIKILLGILVLVDAVTSATRKSPLFIVLFFLSASQFYFTLTQFSPFDAKCRNTFLTS